jgi:protein TonB
MIDEPPLTDVELGRGAVTGRVEGAVPEGVVNALANVIAAVRLQAPPPKASVAPTPVAPPPARIEVSRGVQEAMIVHRVMPVYPPLARQARISGVVELHGVITAEGRIGELRVIAGHPLLVQAAVEAVRQWVYRPTLLNGKPVEVEAPIVVRFTLN